MRDSNLNPDLQQEKSLAPSRDGAALQLDDELLLRQTFAQDARSGLELLFRRYHAPLCSHAVRFVYSKPIAEDLVSEVFFQFYKSEAYRHISTSFLSYLFRSVRNEAYSYLRREMRQTCTLGSDLENQQEAQAVSPDAEIHYNQLFLKINETIAQLPAQCQRVFLLSRFEDKKYQEIADELQISPKTVEAHISKALRHLRLALRNDWMIP